MARKSLIAQNNHAVGRHFKPRRFDCIYKTLTHEKHMKIREI